MCKACHILCLFVTNYFHFISQSARLEHNFLELHSLQALLKISVSLLRFLGLKHQLPQIQHLRNSFLECYNLYTNACDIIARFKITRLFSSWKDFVSVSQKVGVSCNTVDMFLKSCTEIDLWQILLTMWSWEDYVPRTVH